MELWCMSWRRLGGSSLRSCSPRRRSSLGGTRRCKRRMPSSTSGRVGSTPWSKAEYLGDSTADQSTSHRLQPRDNQLLPAHSTAMHTTAAGRSTEECTMSRARQQDCILMKTPLRMRGTDARMSIHWGEHRRYCIDTCCSGDCYRGISRHY